MHKIYTESKLMVSHDAEIYEIYEAGIENYTLLQ